MRQVHGFVEFQQMDEWFGVVDIGSLLVPNAQLTILLQDAARRDTQDTLPSDASVNFEERYMRVKQDATGVAMLTYGQLGKLREYGSSEIERADNWALLEETLFGVLLDLCTVLAGRFGEDKVRLVFYVD